MTSIPNLHGHVPAGLRRPAVVDPVPPVSSPDLAGAGVAASHCPGALKLPRRAVDVTLVSNAVAVHASGFGSCSRRCDAHDDRS
jgi:hypothetical protein